MMDQTSAGEEAGNQGSTGYVYRVALVAAVGGLLFGYDTAVIAGAIDHLEGRFKLDELAKGWAAASALLGCIGGAAFVGMLSDWLGRKKVQPFPRMAMGTAMNRPRLGSSVLPMIGSPRRGSEVRRSWARFYHLPVWRF